MNISLPITHGPSKCQKKSAELIRSMSSDRADPSLTISTQMSIETEKSEHSWLIRLETHQIGIGIDFLTERSSCTTPLQFSLVIWVRILPTESLSKQIYQYKQILYLK